MQETDFLTCGVCQVEFPLADIVVFMQHKKYNCSEKYLPGNGQGTTHSKYSCGSCPKKFSAAVSLLKHAQLNHRMQIYLEGAGIESMTIVPEKQENVGVGASLKDSVKETDRLGVLASVATGEEVAQSSSPTEGTGESKQVRSKVEEKPPADVAESKEVKTIDEKTAFAPKKCCAAVVPKKRKRHMETKHLLGKAIAKRNIYRNFKTQSQSMGTIYIDFEHSNGDEEEVESSNMSNSGNFEGSSSSQEERTPGSSRRRFHSGKESTMILEPGVTTFSIPVSYPMRIPTGFIGSSYPQHTTTHQGPPVISTATAGPSTTPPNIPTSTTESNSAQSDADATSNISDMTEASNSGMETSNLGPEGNSQSALLAQARKRRYPTSRPFKCEECGNSFNQRIHLKKHLYKHTGQKPFKCNECDYSTVERSHLKVHIRIHTGEKPFKCTYCEYATAQNSTLKIHLKRHHGFLELSCTSCGKQFQQKDMLEDHQKQHGSTPSPKKESEAMPMEIGSEQTTPPPMLSDNSHPEHPPNL